MLHEFTIHQTPPDVPLPARVEPAGKQAARRLLEFFTVKIRNKNTRAAYGQAAGTFRRWCEDRGITRIEGVRPVHVAAYMEELGKLRAIPTAKQHLACIRILFDRLVAGQAIATNPAHACAGRATPSSMAQPRRCHHRESRPFSALSRRPMW